MCLFPSFSLYFLSFSSLSFFVTFACHFDVCVCVFVLFILLSFLFSLYFFLVCYDDGIVLSIPVQLNDTLWIFYPLERAFGWFFRIRYIERSRCHLLQRVDYPIREFVL